MKYLLVSIFMIVSLIACGEEENSIDNEEVVEALEVSTEEGALTECSPGGAIVSNPADCKNNN